MNYDFNERNGDQKGSTFSIFRKENWMIVMSEEYFGEVDCPQD